MKTAMQILKENISLSDILSPQTKAVVVAFIDNLLEKEKEQIMDAYIGATARDNKFIDPETYYNQTYNK